MADCDAAIDIAQGFVFVLLVLTLKVVLPNIVQGQLLSAELNNVGFGDDALGKEQHRVFKGGGKEKHLTTGV